MKVEELLKHIAKALEVNESEITIESSSQTVDVWDSLGHITILSAIDDLTNGASAELADLTQVSSVKEIVKVLSENGLLEE
jgi:acyl carrier protein